MKIFKTIKKATEFINNPSIPLVYKEQKAVELLNYLKPVAKPLSNATITVSGIFSNSESLINAVEDRLYKGNYVVQWNKVYQERSDMLMAEIARKENEYYA